MSEKPTETYYIKIQGKANIPEALSIGHNFKVVADCSVTQEQRDDNEDGTLDVTYKVVPVTAEISKDNGPTIKAVDPRRNSQKIRNYLFKHYHDEGVVEPFDEVYDAFTFEVMSMTPQLLRGALKRINR
jgi:hypothetical protein